jgi:cysteine desulfurase
MTCYLDCAATTPIDPRVRDEVVRYMDAEFGNAGSRTHEFGERARRAVEKARDQVAAVVGASRGEVVFTSGATEANNLAILGLVDHGRRIGRTHVASTAIEHNAVLEPLQELGRRGFEVTLVPPNRGGWVDPQALRAAVRDNTLLVSIMQVNNETGVIQPLDQIASLLADHPAYLHVDAAQGFGKEVPPLRNNRIDLISISGHKLHAPKGIGALVSRRRGDQKPPLAPLMFGGGQERGLRPGTLPVHLIVGLGLASELAVSEADQRAAANRQFRERALKALASLDPVLAGDQDRVVPHILNLSFPNIDADQAMEALAGIAAISNGSACTSQSLTCSHVLSAMRLPADQIEGALRLSWCHLTPDPDWPRFVEAIRQLRV